MCRIIFSLNQSNIESKITHFLLQSTNVPNALDGYGFAALDLTKHKWKIKKTPKPAPHDQSLREEIANTFADYPLVIGHLRNAQIIDTPQSTIDNVLMASLHNTHPFYHSNKMFIHNGKLDDAYLPSMRQWFQENILPEYWTHIKGNTDSECLFYLLLSIIKKRECIHKDNDMDEKYEELRDAVKECFDLLHSKFSAYIANFVYADKEYSVVGHLKKNVDLRGKRVNTLYIANQSKKNELLFATEPLDKTQKYELVDWGCIYVVHNGSAEYRKYNLY